MNKRPICFLVFLRQIATVVCVLFLLTACAKSVPVTDNPTNGNEQSPVLAEVLVYLSDIFIIYDEMTEQYKYALDTVERFLDTGETESTEMIRLVENAMKKLNETTFPANPFESKETQFSDAGLSYLYFNTELTDFNTEQYGFINNLNTIYRYLAEYTLDDRNEILAATVEIYQTILENVIKMRYITLNSFLIDIDEGIAKDFCDSSLTKLPSHKREASDWYTSESVLEEWMSKGKKNVENAILAYEVLLSGQQREQDEGVARSRELFKPEDSDNLETLWGKALRLHTLKDDKYSVLCLDLFVQKAESGEDDRFSAESAKKIADTAAAFWRESREGKREGGVIVFYFKPPNGHAFLHVGDIIIEVNGVPCNVFKDYTDNKKADEPNTLTYLRLENGQLIEHQKSAAFDPNIILVGSGLIEYFN